MIRCIKLWTGADRKSHFEEGFIDLEPGTRGDALSVKFPIASASFHETDADPNQRLQRQDQNNGRALLIATRKPRSDW
jgi:hypothetical protein